MSCFYQRDMECLLWVILCIWPRYMESSKLYQGKTQWWDWAFRFDKLWFRKSGQWCCYACALLLWYFCCCFLWLLSLGYLLCSSFTAHCCLAFSPFWSVLRAWMGAPIKTYANLRGSPVSHTTVKRFPPTTTGVLWDLQVVAPGHLRCRNSRRSRRNGGSGKVL